MAFPPTLKQLRYLIALHKTLHFGKAAELCLVTQSTLSAGLQELEALLDLRLVERTKRHVMFTAEGEAVVERAVKILADVEDLTSMAAAAKDPTQGLVRLGVIPTIAPYLLPCIMPKLQAELPDLDIHLREEKSGVLCDKLKSGELDLVLFALPFACGEVTEYPLFDDRFLAAYPKGEAAGKEIRTDDLKDARLLLLEEGHCLRDHALSACNLLGAQARAAYSGTSLATLIQMVASGQGVTLLPEMAVTAGLADQADLDVVAFSDISPTRQIGLIWRPANPREATFLKLGEAIKSIAA